MNFLPIFQALIKCICSIHCVSFLDCIFSCFISHLYFPAAIYPVGIFTIFLVLNIFFLLCVRVQVSFARVCGGQKPS